MYAQIEDMSVQDDKVIGAGVTNIPVKVPKRVLHFCDGVLEEYSDDETTSPPAQTTVMVDQVSSTMERL